MSRTWRERIDAARWGFTGADRKDAKNWETCAVGEQVANGIVPHWNDGWLLWLRDLWRVFVQKQEPVGLAGLGCSFYCAVMEDDAAHALRLLDAIEDRALALKRESLGAAAATHP